MNPLLTKLKQQSGLENNTDQDSIDCFFQLIIKESCDTLLKWRGEPFPFDEDIAVRLLKEHFGVK